MKFLVLLGCMFSVLAQAKPLAEWRRATVQVSSFPCLTERPRFSGSGLLVAHGGQVWVLTSEHVVIQDKSVATCQEGAGEWGAAKLELVTADYLRGLALLRVMGVTDGMRKAAVALEDLNLRADAGELAALGFPSGSDQLQVLAGGQVVNPESRRALIAGVPALIEASGLPVEYGMSGGLLLGKNGGDYFFAGILSHQVLRREAGKPTGAGEVKPGEGGNRNDLALTIPAVTAAGWFASAVKGGQSGWERSAPAQKAGVESVQYGPLLFALKAKNAKDVWEVGGADGSGIGGGDGSGIGGGGNSGLTGEELLIVEVTLNPAADAALKSRALADPVLEQWRGWLLSGRVVQAVFLKNSEAKRLLKISSLAQFFTYWLRDHYVPVAVRSKSGDLRSDGEELIRLAGVAAALAQEARDRAAATDRKAWLSLLRDTAVLAQNGLASSADVLGTLTGDNDLFWREYYDADFDAAVALEASIQKLAQQMKKMGL